VGREHERAGLGGHSEQLVPRGPRFGGVLAEARVGVRLHDLLRGVHEIADEQRPVAAGFQVQHGRTRRVPGREVEPQPPVDPVRAVPQLDQPGLVHGRDAVFEHVLVAPPEHARVVVGGVPEVEVPPRHEVGGVGEGGYPRPAVEPGVPADVVGVQVGVDHEIDVFRAHAGRGEVVEETGVAVRPQPGVGPLLVVAGSRVDEDRAAFAAQHPGLDRRADLVRLGVPEVGGQPVAVLLPRPRGAAGEELGRGHLDRAVVLLDAGDGDVPQRDFFGDRVHGFVPVGLGERSTFPR
jgi:hypothetical protein